MAKFSIKSSADGMQPDGSFDSSQCFFKEGNTLEELAETIKEFKEWGMEHHFHLYINAEGFSIDAAISLDSIGNKEHPFLTILQALTKGELTLVYSPLKM